MMKFRMNKTCTGQPDACTRRIRLPGSNSSASAVLSVLNMKP